MREVLMGARMKINGHCSILNVELTCSFCYDLSCLVLQRGGDWALVWAAQKYEK